MSVFQSSKTYGLFPNAANKKIISELEEIGARMVLFPDVETAETINSADENLLKNLSNFDWIIFQNIYAADYFLHALERLEIDFFELDALRICAFGETVADRLRYVQVHSDVISINIETKEVFRALSSYEPDLENLEFLIPIEFEKKSEIANQLSKIGSGVKEIPLYQTKINESADLPKFKALLKGGAIDEIIFGSPIDTQNLAILFHPENLSSLLSETIVSATDLATFQSLRELGFGKIIMR